MSEHPFWTFARLLAVPWRWVFSTDDDWLTRLLGFKRKSATVVCPHCRTENDLFLLTDCRCGTREYGSRLECSGCGMRWRSFNCDHPSCGATIYVE